MGAPRPTHRIANPVASIRLPLGATNCCMSGASASVASGKRRCRLLWREGNADGWRRGLGDIALAFKQVVFDSLRRGSIFSWRNHVVGRGAADAGQPQHTPARPAERGRAGSAEPASGTSRECHGVPAVGLVRRRTSYRMVGSLMCRAIGIVSVVWALSLCMSVAPRATQDQFGNWTAYRTALQDGGELSGVP